MDDQSIINLYWAREERAIEETEKKYGSYCRSIARNILRNRADEEECLNDTWLKTWNSLPPQRPIFCVLSAPQRRGHKRQPIYSECTIKQATGDIRRARASLRSFP